MPFRESRVRCVACFVAWCKKHANGLRLIKIDFLFAARTVLGNFFMKGILLKTGCDVAGRSRMAALVSVFVTFAADAARLSVDTTMNHIPPI